MNVDERVFSEGLRFVLGKGREEEKRRTGREENERME